MAAELKASANCKEYFERLDGNTSDFYQFTRYLTHRKMGTFVEFVVRNAPARAHLGARVFLF